MSKETVRQIRSSAPGMLVILLVGVAAGYPAGEIARGSGPGLLGDAAGFNPIGLRAVVEMWDVAEWCSAPITITPNSSHLQWADLCRRTCPRDVRFRLTSGCLPPRAIACTGRLGKDRSPRHSRRSIATAITCSARSASVSHSLI